MDDDLYNDYPREPGRGFRFAAGLGSGLRSSTWQIGTAPKKRDVYLSIAHLGQVVKVSFHESGEWQFSLDQSVAMQFVERNRDRHLAKWTRPEPFAGGLRRAFYITFPRTELREHEDVGEVRLAPDPGGEHWVTVDILFVEPDNNVQLNYPHGAFVLGRLQIFSGGEVLVIARPQVPDRNAASQMRHAREGILNAIIEGRVPGEGSRPGGLTMAGFFLQAADGTPGVIELAFTEPPTEVRKICTSSDTASGHVDLYPGQGL